MILIEKLLERNPIEKYRKNLYKNNGHLFMFTFTLFVSFLYFYFL